MTLLIFYVLLALGVSFLCSVAEAVLLSVTPAFIRSLEEEEHRSGALLAELKSDIDKPLAAILTLNTIAHTVGAAGAGAQANTVFGNQWLAAFSAVLTLLILFLSEIIPKTLGAYYWRKLAPTVAHFLKWLVLALRPFVFMSDWITSRIKSDQAPAGLSRNEMAAMADLSVLDGQLAENEAIVMKNLLRLREAKVKSAMTPRIVLFALPESMTVETFFHKHDNTPFSRIPVYTDTMDQITGFVLRSDILLAQGRGNSSKLLRDYRRELPALMANMSLSQAFSELIRQNAQLCLVVDEYGGVEGLLSMEDIVETLFGLEIVDERDKHTDMQVVARKLWRRRAEKMGIDIDQLEQERDDSES